MYDGLRLHFYPKVVAVVEILWPCVADLLHGEEPEEHRAREQDD